MQEEIRVYELSNPIQIVQGVPRVRCTIIQDVVEVILS